MLSLNSWRWFSVIKFYVERVRSGKCTLDDVPKKYRDAVKAELENE